MRDRPMKYMVDMAQWFLVLASLNTLELWPLFHALTIIIFVDVA